MISYLWQDVFRNEDGDADSPFTLKEGNDQRNLSFASFYGEHGVVDEELLEKFLRNLGLVPLPDAPAAAASPTPFTDTGFRTV